MAGNAETFHLDMTEIWLGVRRSAVNGARTGALDGLISRVEIWGDALGASQIEARDVADVPRRRFPRSCR